MKKIRYKLIKIKKRNGSFRYITVQPYVKKFYKGVKEAIQEIKSLISECKATDNLFGFIPGQKVPTVMNALVHANNRYIYNVDIKSFFDNVDYEQIRKALEPFLWGCEEQFKDTVEEIREARLTRLKNAIAKAKYPVKFIVRNLKIIEDVKRMYQMSSFRYKILAEFKFYPLQGLSLSPLFATLSGISIDKFIEERRPESITYSRYVDDLTFSSNNKEELIEFVSRIKLAVRPVLNFRFSEEKTKFYDTQKGRAEITGFYVQGDGRVYLNRETRRRIRAAIHNVTKRNKDLLTFVYSMKLPSIVQYLIYLACVRDKQRCLGLVQLLKYHGKTKEEIEQLWKK